MTAVPMSSATISSNPLSHPSPTPNRIRALIAENSPTPGVAIYALLRSEDRIEIVGRVTDGQQTMEAVNVLQPELLLIDVRMPHVNGITTAAILSHRYPALHIVLMSDHDSRRLSGQADVSCTQFLVYKPRFMEEFNSLLPRIEGACRELAHNEHLSARE